MALVKCNHCGKETQGETGKCIWCNKEFETSATIERDYRKEDSSENKSSVTNTHSWNKRKQYQFQMGGLSIAFISTFILFLKVFNQYSFTTQANETENFTLTYVVTLYLGLVFIACILTVFELLFRYLFRMEKHSFLESLRVWSWVVCVFSVISFLLAIISPD